LSTNLAEKAEALAAANKIIRNLRAGARTSAGSGTTTTTRSASIATPRARSATNNENYCWSHGYQIHEDHTSLTCTRRSAGHQEAATKTNNMGGCQWGRDAVWQPGAASDRVKHIKHYNHCLPYTGYTPTQKHIAILYSGCTGHYLKVTAPVTNKKRAVAPINVTLPDGATIQSTHMCDFLLPQLPLAATKAHIIPGLDTSSLLYVGQLFDANCSVKFDQTSAEVLHNHKRILEGFRNERNGLWKVDLQDNNSHSDKDKTTTTNLKSKQAHRVYECTNKGDFVRFLHAAAFSPVQDTWLKAIRAGHFATWPGLAEDLVRKHLPK
jgi:hypothetical protein